jgi:hypothetical protein
MRSLAYRRYQMQRAKARTRRLLRRWWAGRCAVARESLDEWVDAPMVGRMSTTRKRCSRWCCGNPRRHYGELTRQERIAAEAAKMI